MLRVFSFKSFIALLMVMFMAGSAWAGTDDPKVVVEDAVNGIIRVLEARQDATRLTEADRDKIRKVVAGRFDYREMSQRSLAQTWNDISEAEKTDFTELFRKLLERSYGNRLASFRNQKVTFDDAQFKRDKARVITSVIDVEKTTPVEYRLHQTATGWQVYDIRIEGVSLVSNFRKDFQEGLMQNGGFSGLVKALEEKVKQLEEKDNA
ncbi:MAG: ABC transporter substrate-binding protein [Mariprofundaceae bacterium]|nr:ABC transporter substrate-binding protein [Mariprofundaceae bacterium]